MLFPGPAQEYPPNIVIWMKPNNFASKEADDKWHKKKKAYDDAIAAKAKEEEEAAKASN